MSRFPEERLQIQSADNFNAMHCPGQFQPQVSGAAPFGRAVVVQGWTVGRAQGIPFAGSLPVGFLISSALFLLPSGPDFPSTSLTSGSLSNSVPTSCSYLAIRGRIRIPDLTFLLVCSFHVTHQPCTVLKIQGQCVSNVQFNSLSISQTPCMFPTNFFYL